MKTQALISISIVTISALLTGCDLPENVESSAAELPEETFVERAARTRLNADSSRFETQITDETVLERAVRTRASALVERAESEFYAGQ
jgi:hypothetical protein